MGIGADDTLSPHLQEKLTYLGTVLSSFPEAHRATAVLLENVFGVKRIERLTERIGRERVVERDADVAAWQRRTLVEKQAAPAGVKAPAVAGLMPDGGRLQLCQKNEESSTHWHEYKAACLLELESETHEIDPCPDVPEVFLQRDHIRTLTRDIGKKAPDAALPSDVESDAVTAEPASLANSPPADDAQEGSPYSPPKILSRDVVATRRDSKAFGKMFAARAWELGMFAAARKAYVGDGQNWLWSLWERHFKPFGFVPILDFIHALTYVYASASAGRSEHEGWAIFVRWITWVWRGEVSQVIVELAERQQEIGLPSDEDGPTSVRSIVSQALTYLQNQQSRMNYPKYRKQGLPVTSSHIESTVKLLNHRVKGTEKFWSESGAEALLQLKADTLSDTAPLETFWHHRPNRTTGCRPTKTAAA